MSKIQNQINLIDALIATRPAVLQNFKAAKAAGDDAAVKRLTNQLKYIQEQESLKPVLLEKLTDSVARLGKSMEFGGFSITQN